MYLSGARQRASEDLAEAEREGSSRRDIFNMPQKQIYNLMKMDSFPRFLQSNIFKVKSPPVQHLQGIESYSPIFSKCRVLQSNIFKVLGPTVQYFQGVESSSPKFQGMGSFSLTFSKYGVLKSNIFKVRVPSVQQFHIFNASGPPVRSFKGRGSSRIYIFTA